MDRHDPDGSFAKRKSTIRIGEASLMRARDYFANEKSASVQRATALLVGTPVSRTIGNFFMGLNRPVSPTRLLTDPQKAIEWLHTFSDA